MSTRHRPPPGPPSASGAAQAIDPVRRATLRHALLAVTGTGALASVLLAPGAAHADLPALVARVRDSVLPIGTFNPLASPRFGFRGSGFVVGDGTRLITNAHVLPDPATAPPPQLAVLGGAAMRQAVEGRELRRARLLELDRERDLAVLELEGAPLQPLELAAPEGVREGMEIVLLGFPVGGVFGFSPVTHRGIVASITAIALPSPQARQLDERAVARLRDGAFEVYQLDATAYPGNSGGPVLDVATGRVVGVVNMVLVRGARETALTNPTGITYAIPVRFVQELLARR